MSYPCLVFGSFGDEKAASSTKIGSLPLGTRMMLPDGRLFAHARASATALVAGYLYQGEAGGSDNIRNMAVQAAAAIGALQVKLTLGATTATTKDSFADGFLYVNDATGEGHNYKIKGNNAAAVSTTATFDLYENDGILVALEAGTSEVGIRKSPFDKVLLKTADTVHVHSYAGVATRAVLANYYCWLQRKGECAVFVDGTWLLGAGLVASTTSACAGMLTPILANSANAEPELIEVLGRCISVGSSTEYGLVELMLPF